MDQNQEKDFVMEIREIDNEYILIIENKIKGKFQTRDEAFKSWFDENEIKKEVEMHNKFTKIQIEQWQKKWSISLGMLMRKKK